MQKIRQPAGVWPMFVLQLIGMVSFSMIFSLITLYVTTKSHFGGLGFTSNHAYAIAAAFNALSFATSLPGGYLAERYLGYQFGIVLSIIMSILGMLIISIHTVTVMYIGLGVFIVASGLMIPCMYVILGRLYKENDQRREGGFVIAYVGMNVGALIASITSGTISNTFGYSTEFTIGAVVTLLMLPVLYLYRHVFQLDANVRSIVDRFWGTGWIAILTILTILLIDYAMICNALLLILGVASVVLVFAMAFTGKDPQVRPKLLVFIFLTIVSVAFWGLYSLQASALPIFTRFNIDRTILGWTIPTADLSSLNPIYIIVIGPLLTLLWNRLSRRGRNVLPPVKFATGIFLMGFGYLLLAMGIHFAAATGLVALVWLVLSYLFQTTGELMVGPVGYAMVGSLVPKHREGLMMGIWQLATGVGGALSAYFAEYTGDGKNHAAIHTDPSFDNAFLIFGLCTCAIGICVMIVSPALRKVFD